MAETETTIYGDDDADLSVLDGRTVAFVGYGNQGRSQALNLRDSGVDVVVGNREDGYREQIREDGFEPVSIAQAAEQGDVICLLVPDEVAPEVFRSHVEPNLDEGDTLYVSHGYNLTYDLLGHPEWVDVVMVAPRMGGPAVRTLYESGQGFPSILAVEQDHTGEALETVLAMAKAVGSTQAGVVEGTADMETITDLLTEQALFPIVANAMLAKFQVEVAYGIPPEIVMSELYLSHEFAEIFEDLSREYHVIAPDLPGFGRSDRPPLLYSASLYETFLRDAIRGLADEPRVVASSLSGAYAAGAATEVDVDSLVLIAPTDSTMGETPRSWLRTLFRTPLVGTGLFNLLVSKPGIRHFHRDHGYANVDNLTEATLDYQWKTAHQPGARYAPASFVSGYLDPGVDLAETLADVDAPVTLVWGRDADVTPVSGGRALAKKTDSRLVVFDDTLLLPHVEHPEKFRDVVRGTLAER